MAGVAILLVAGLLAWAFLALRRRLAPVPDVPQLLVAAAASLLPADRGEWAQAMVGELDRLSGRAARWRFALSCTRAAVLAPPRPDAPGRLMVTAAVTAAAGCLALVGYSLIRYPRLVTGPATWLELSAFLVVLAGYPVTARFVVRRLDRPSLRTIRAALLGGTLVAACWIGVGAAISTQAAGYVFVLLWLLIPLTSLSVGLLGARHGRAAATGRQAAVLSGVGAGLLVFLSWVSDTLLRAGRPYDAGMIRDFHTSGAPDLATYAVSDNLGSAMMMLLIVPMLATLFGLLGAALGARHSPAMPIAEQG